MSDFEEIENDFVYSFNALSKRAHVNSKDKGFWESDNKGEKIAFVGGNSLAKTTLLQILAGELEPDSGRFRWGVTITNSYFPKENSAYFANDLSLVQRTQFPPEVGCP